MGITGLLPLLKSIHNNTHISDFAGKTIAVDGYVWLHRGAYACATELVTGKTTHKYVEYFLHRIRLLRHHKIQPYIVFDGGPLPAKKGTESERRRRREESLAQAQALTSAGKHSEARDLYSKCVDVTPQMAFQVIKALKVESVPYIVAPYEADAQLVFLESAGIVDGIMTEDSDLLVFGARLVLFKFDISGSVTAISRADFGSVHSASLSLIGWSDTRFREMAMLSGCDYLPSIQGMGLITASKLMRKYSNVERTLQFLRLEGTKKIPKGYLENFRMAELAFLYQRVYDPRIGELVNLAPPPEEEWDEAKEAFVGRRLEPAVAKGVAEGDIDPVTLDRMEDINPTYIPTSRRQIQRLPLVETARANTPPDVPEMPKGGLFGYFTPLAKNVGKASGKTSLADVMQQDLAKRKKSSSSPARNRSPKKSRFFSSPSKVSVTSPMKKLPKRSRDSESIEPSTPRRTKSLKQVADERDVEDVQQDDGYLSPLSVRSAVSWASANGMTSPVAWSPESGKRLDEDDPLSSPVAYMTQSRTLLPAEEGEDASRITLPSLELRQEPVIEVQPGGVDQADEPCIINGPDLFSHPDAVDTDMEDLQCDRTLEQHGSSSSLRMEPITPCAEEAFAVPPATQVNEDDLDDIDEEELFRERSKKISDGWRNAYSFASLSLSRSRPILTKPLNRAQQIRQNDEASSSPLLQRRHSAPLPAPKMPVLLKTPTPLLLTQSPLRRTTSAQVANEMVETPSRRPSVSVAVPSSAARLAAFRFRG